MIRFVLQLLLAVAFLMLLGLGFADAQPRIPAWIPVACPDERLGCLGNSDSETIKYKKIPVPRRGITVRCARGTCTVTVVTGMTRTAAPVCRCLRKVSWGRVSFTCTCTSTSNRNSNSNRRTK